MKCAWDQLIKILPSPLRENIDKLSRDTLLELRLRRDMPVQLIGLDHDRILHIFATGQMMEFIINTATRYSPWLSVSSCCGYITAPGGHRIGICGEVVYDQTKITGFRQISSLNIRVARDFPGISGNLSQMEDSILILGQPGTGKTTLLRDLIRQRSLRNIVGVVDQRQELFPPNANFDIGVHTDILCGCPKKQGVEMLLRTMTPTVIALDEITAQEDCEAMIDAGWCGVSFYATAHASSVSDLRNRPIYRSILRSGIFSQAVVLNRDKSWKLERIVL